MSNKPTLLKLWTPKYTEQKMLQVSEMTGYSRADVLSRAVGWYALLTEKVFLPGKVLAIYDPDEGSIQTFTRNHGETT